MDNIEEKLLAYFSGTAEEQTVREIEEWAGQSDENRELARQTAYICAAADSLKTIAKVDAESALEKMHARMRMQQRRNIYRRFANAAAMLLLPLLMAAGFFAYEYFHIDESEYVEVRTTSGMIASVTLPDNSSVWLNSNSTLRYPARFVGKTRNVDLSGEGYFKVSADAEKKFIVHTGTMQVEVFGTEFNVDAYDADNRDVRTTLVSGKVQIRYEDGNRSSHVVKMTPGNMLAFNPEDRSIRMSEVDSKVVSSWKDGRIVLQNTTLEDALRMIENRYDVKFKLENGDLLDNRYTGQFSGQRLDVVLEHFRRTTNIHFVRGEITGEGTEIITIY